MKNPDEKSYTLRIQSLLLAKFRYICKYEGRSAQSQLLLYIRRAVESFENKHGEIIIE